MPRRRPGVLLPLEEAILDLGIRGGHTGDAEFYGFALAEDLRTMGVSARPVGNGTLYKALARLEREGLLVSRWEEIDAAAEGRPPRRLYQVTGAAAGALARSRDLRSGAVPTGRWALP